MIDISFHGPMPASEVQSFLESSGFNEQCRAYTQHYWQEFTKDLTPEQLNEVREWWGPGAPANFDRKPGSLRKDFYETLSREAHNAIHSLISVGLG
jgi:hypothetical protein